MSDGLTQAELEKLLMEFACEDIGELKERMKEYHQLCKMKAKLESDVKENSKMKSLEDIRRLVYSQALMKKWNNTTKFLLDEKLPEEYKEFIEAVKSKNAEHTAKELIDVLYIMVQLFHNLDPKLRINLDEIFKQVHYANWKHKKKTKDENGVWCRR